MNALVQVFERVLVGALVVASFVLVPMLTGGAFLLTVGRTILPVRKGIDLAGDAWLLGVLMWGVVGLCYVVGFVLRGPQ